MRTNLPTVVVLLMMAKTATIAVSITGDRLQCYVCADCPDKLDSTFMQYCSDNDNDVAVSVATQTTAFPTPAPTESPVISTGTTLSIANASASNDATASQPILTTVSPFDVTKSTASVSENSSAGTPTSTSISIASLAPFSTPSFAVWTDEPSTTRVPVPTDDGRPEVSVATIAASTVLPPATAGGNNGSSTQLPSLGVIPLRPLNATAAAIAAEGNRTFYAHGENEMLLRKYSNNRLPRNTIDTSYQCYTIKYQDVFSGRVKVKRGCVPKNRSKDATCKRAQGSLVEVDSCGVCDRDGCNSAGVFGVSAPLIIAVLLAAFVGMR